MKDFTSLELGALVAICDAQEHGGEPLRTLWCSTPGLLRRLNATFGETQVFAGSDYPSVAGQGFPGRPFDALDLPDRTLELRADNARRFLGLG